MSFIKKPVENNMVALFRFSLCCALIIGTFATSLAQVDCSQALLHAESAYSIGRFNEVKDLLGECLSNGFNREQKVQGYKLIALSAIFSKNFSTADTAIFKMLKTNPQYQAGPQDPPEFRKRVESFKVHALFEITANLGLIQPFMEISEVYNSRVLNATSSYKGKIGTHVSLSLAYYFTRRISMRVGYESQRYSFIMEDKNAINTGSLTESQSRNQWQVATGYNFNFRKMNLQIYGGLVYSTLKKADVTFVMQREDGSDEIVYFSNLPNRTKNEFRPMAEIKFNVPAKNNWRLNFSLRYEMGLKNLTNAANRYDDLGHAASLEWVEDDFRASYLMASVGFSKWFYRIKLK
jgi:hypothetical protein